MSSDVAYVLDASAVLTILRNEAGAALVRTRLPHACISAVNLSEVVAKLAELRVPDDVIGLTLEDLDLNVRSFDQHEAIYAGRLRMATKARGLSLGDRACLSLAASLGATAVTADRAWRDVDVGVPIELVR
jgi:PIN domain nuclease of toxin-antitoxin system